MLLIIGLTVPIRLCILSIKKEFAVESIARSLWNYLLQPSLQVRLEVLFHFFQPAAYLPNKLMIAAD